MSVLDSMPACRLFYIERELERFDARHAMMEGREDDATELAFVLRADDKGTWPDPSDERRERGFGTLANGEIIIEWASSPREVAAAFSRALTRLGWKRSIHSFAVYGSAS